MQQHNSPLWTSASTEKHHTGTWRNALPQYHTLPSPCHAACPVGGRIAEWVQQLGNGDLYQAWLTLSDNNPFPAIAGRICHHPCEDACNRRQLDDTVGVCSLERHVGDRALAEGWSFPTPNAEKNQSVAVVGAGPAGLSAAFQLRRRGFSVTLLEKAAQLGGLLRYGIPGYRLDKNILDGEIKRIIEMGIDIRLGTTVDDEQALQDLRDQFDAVYLATGACRSKTLPILDYTQTWVMDSAAFLAATNSGKSCDLGERLVVVGGGSAAMDVARTARRQGRSVTVLSLEPESLLPAQRVEVDEALEEGVVFKCGVMLQSVEVGTESRILNCVRVDFTPGGERGAFTVDPAPSSEFQLQTDGIVPAIGQDADFSLWGDSLVGDAAVLSTDNHWRTSLDGVFAGGDLASMQRFVTAAVGMGKEAAAEISRFLDAEDTEAAKTEIPTVPFTAINTSYYPPATRNQPATTAIAARLQSFHEVEQPLKPGQANAEAARCFSCGTCIYCDNCYLYCPDMAIVKLERGYLVKTDYCKGCGLCVEECPTASIAMAEELPGVTP